MTCTPGRICCWPPSECRKSLISTVLTHLAWEEAEGRAGQGSADDLLFWAERVISGRSSIGWQPGYCWLRSPPSQSPVPPPELPPSGLCPPPVDCGLWVCLCLLFQVPGGGRLYELNSDFWDFSSPTPGISGRSFPGGSLFKLFHGYLRAYFCLGFTSPSHHHTATCARPSVFMSPTCAHPYPQL